MERVRSLETGKIREVLLVLLEFSSFEVVGVFFWGLP